MKKSVKRLLIEQESVTDGQTDKQTIKHTDIATYRLIGPKAPCSEKYGQLFCYC